MITIACIGRATGRPVPASTWAEAALAAGDVASRPVDGQGQDELTEMQHNVDSMGDLLEAPMSNEANLCSVAERTLAANPS